MESNYKAIEKIADQGYSLDLSKVLEKSFETYKKIVGIAGVSMMIISIVLAVVFGGLFGALVGFSNFTETMAGLQSGIMSESSQVTIIATSAILAAVFSPITAGILKMAQLANANQKFGVDTVFDYFKTHHFKDLFISALLISVVGNSLSFLLVYFHIPIVGNIIVGVIGFLTFLSIPLIAFSNLNAIEAITMSARLVLKNPFIIFVLLLVGIIFAMLGIIAFCIGIFFSLPFYYVVYYTIYNEIVPANSKSELDEIGTTQEF